MRCHAFCLRKSHASAFSRVNMGVKGSIAMHVNKAVLAFLTILGLTAAEAQDCSESYRQFAGNISLEAYVGGQAASLPDLEVALSTSMEIAQSGDSCGALEYLEGTEVGKRLMASWNAREPSSFPFGTTDTNIQPEVDWSSVSGIPSDYIDTDLHILDEYIETVKSCNTKFPGSSSARKKNAQDHITRIGYESLFERVKNDKYANDQETEFQLGRLMSLAGEDTRDWTETKCNEYALQTPYDRMYIKRYREE
jgi:hypothetical protein